MNILMARRSICLQVIFSMSMLLQGSVWHCFAEDRGSRPIEFSEPRTGGDPATNEQDFGSERRRLTDLEDRLSKTFSFFEFEDSMSGTPAPRAPRRVPVTPKPSKRSGFLVDEENWAFSDPLNSPKDEDLEKDEKGFWGRLLEGQERESSGQRGANLLKSLRSDDWLVNGAESDTFWEMPLASRETSEPADYLRAHQEQIDPSFGSASQVDLWPRLERLMGAKERQMGTKDDALSILQHRESEKRSFVDVETHQWDPYSRQRPESRTDPYRALLGFGVNDPLNAPLVSTTPVQSRSETRRYTPTPLTTEGFAGSSSRQSLEPVLSAGKSSFLPTTPRAPTHATVFDSLEVEPPLNSAPASTVSQPFYQPLRRQY